MIQSSGQKESRSPVGAGKAASEKILQSEYSASGAKSQAWRQAEHAADARTAKELAPLMLWAMTEREPVVMRDTLDHYDLRYSHIEAVYFRPTEPALTVRLRDVAADSITRPNARDVSLLRDEPDELPDVWQRINLTTERKEEIFEAMRRAYVVTHAGTEYRRISAMIFERNMHGRASVLLEVVDRENPLQTLIFPQATVGISNHLLNREEHQHEPNFTN